MTDLAAALAALHARVPFGMRLGLDLVRACCLELGEPERSFPAVHVAGTNGKGSTCALVEASARASGLRTGLYTSPHLVRFAERIRIDGEPIDDHALANALSRSLASSPELSFFEVATLAAFLAFRDAAIDLAILEVGLGGRLDATNVIPPPRCAAIVNIALDHQSVLGDTLDAIAREKAAIAKPGAPIVFGVLPDEAHVAAAEVARASGARIVEAAPLADDVEVALLGSHQRKNAAVAWAIGREIGLAEPAMRRGLASATWPGRLERVVAADGQWLLDGAHNPDGAAALVRALAGEPPGAIVFGALADKAWREILAEIARIDAPRFYVAPAGRAAAPPEVLAAAAPGTACASLEEALVAARRAAGARTVLVCGSLYLVGAARARLLELSADPIVAL